jgi:hypothetical protein
MSRERRALHGSLVPPLRQGRRVGEKAATKGSMGAQCSLLCFSPTRRPCRRGGTSDPCNAHPSPSSRSNRTRDVGTTKGSMGAQCSLLCSLRSRLMGGLPADGPRADRKRFACCLPHWQRSTCCWPSWYRFRSARGPSAGSPPMSKSIWGPERPDERDIFEVEGEGIPPTSMDKDQYQWGCSLSRRRVATRSCPRGRKAD